MRRFERLFGPEFGHGKPFDLTALRHALEALGSPHEQSAAGHPCRRHQRQRLDHRLHARDRGGGGAARCTPSPSRISLQLNERFVVSSEFASDEVLLEAAEDVARVGAEPHAVRCASRGRVPACFSETPARSRADRNRHGRARRFHQCASTSPPHSVITPIGLDHQDALGATLAEIAAHKAGHSEARRAGGHRAASAGGDGGDRSARGADRRAAVSRRRRMGRVCKPRAARGADRNARARSAAAGAAWARIRSTMRGLRARRCSRSAPSSSDDDAFAAGVASARLAGAACSR